MISYIDNKNEISVALGSVFATVTLAHYLIVTNFLNVFIIFSGRGGAGMKGGAKVIIEAHRHEGVFIARSKEDALVTLNSTPGESHTYIH